MKNVCLAGWGGALVLVMLLWGGVSVAAPSSEASPTTWNRSSTQVDDYDKLTATEREVQSLGCLVAGSSVGMATVLFGGTGLAFLGGQGAATATAVAIPVLSAAIATGCAIGAQAALGVVWLHHHQRVLLDQWKIFYSTPSSIASPTPPK
ncbi:membrane hypothetical protein [Gammaproteobacteria bacterium]